MADKDLSNDSSQEAGLSSYVKMMKFAAALACIRSKPDNMTAVEYTQQLCNKFQTKQLKCQQKCEEQETEILHLKQKLIFPKLYGNEKPTDQQSDFDVDDSSTAFLTPPCSGTGTDSDTSRTKEYKETIDQHRQFLQGVINLRTINDSSVQFNEVTKSTLLHSLRVIYDCLNQSDNNQVPVKSLTESIDCIKTLLDSNKVKELSPLVDSLVNITTAAVYRMVASVENTKVTEKAEYINLVVKTLHPLILPQGLAVLVNTIGQLSNHLRQVCKETVTIDTQKFENMFYVIKILEDSVVKYRTELVKSHPDFINFVLERLDDALLHLTVKFPLYAHALWKIHAILSHMAVT